MAHVFPGPDTDQGYQRDADTDTEGEKNAAVKGGGYHVECG